MSDPIDDLSALRIERAPLESNRRGWGKWVFILVLLAAVGGGARWWTTRVVPLEVEVAPVRQRLSLIHI